MTATLPDRSIGGGSGGSGLPKSVVAAPSFDFGTKTPAAARTTNIAAENPATSRAWRGSRASNGAPGRRSWCTTNPNRLSAVPWAVWPATVMGAVAPASGAGPGSWAPGEHALTAKNNTVATTEAGRGMAQRFMLC